MSLPYRGRVRHIFLRPGETVMISQLENANHTAVGGATEETAEETAEEAALPLQLPPLALDHVNPNSSEHLTQTSDVVQGSIPPPPPYLPIGSVRVFAAFNRVPTPDELRAYWPYEESHMAYLVVCGARIAILPLWEMAKPLVHGITSPIFKKYDTFTLALERYTQCFNRVNTLPYPSLRPVPINSTRLCRTPYDLSLPELANSDVELALDLQGRIYSYAMGSNESQHLIRITR
ncbi:hypothetical protein K435DRAFT_861210 [Dendrothele bispora CBS 962.96]|uniref:Uncharacterized protein n=1 Tax=Dendrothele bispora (strain CBS 962.96) TaxID=1314807 RepID=A0A4S8LW03_DENBC|nr:hypothetical protein K435DRAFT_799435 [Dendrothele bispora CBS 962.96]THU93767.1 hypothetical protein K435DRAFT_861210 [Dendrothele bispora CBS 962.96]